MRGSRRNRGHHLSSRPQALDTDVDGRVPVLQHCVDDALQPSSYGEDVEARGTRVDNQESPGEGDHGEKSRVFRGNGTFVETPPGSGLDSSDLDEFEPVLPGNYLYNEELDERGDRYQQRGMRSHSNLKHERYDGDGGYNDSDTASDAYDDAYDFSLSRENGSPLVPDSTIDSATKASENAPIISEPQIPISGSNPAKFLHIIRSLYAGDGSIGRLQAAQLIAIHDVNQSSRKGVLPLFRWMCVNSSISGGKCVTKIFQATSKIQP